MHYVVESYSTAGMGAIDRLIHWMVSEMLAENMLFQIVAAVERPEAVLHWQALAANIENILGGFALDRHRLRSW
jgi:hypothetical protein